MTGAAAAEQHLKVLVTRPEPENQALCQALLAQKWSPVKLPLLDFVPLTPPACPANWHPRTIIVVSPRAADHGVKWLAENHPCLLAQSGAKVEWIAIGPATQEKLIGLGVTPCNKPTSNQNSERLLQTPYFQALPNNSNVLVLKGQGGRTVIQSTLSNQGHTVRCINVYKRSLPSYTVAQRQALFDAKIACFTVTSTEILQNLSTLLRMEPISVPTDAPRPIEHNQPQRPKWLDTPLIVVGDRQAKDARQLGFRYVTIAPGADNQSMIETLNQWREQIRIEPHE
jgi:uroporphyrinogen-III synthase